MLAKIRFYMPILILCTGIIIATIIIFSGKSLTNREIQRNGDLIVPKEKIPETFNPNYKSNPPGADIETYKVMFKDEIAGAPTPNSYFSEDKDYYYKVNGFMDTVEKKLSKQFTTYIGGGWYKEEKDGVVKIYHRLELAPIADIESFNILKDGEAYTEIATDSKHVYFRGVPQILTDPESFKISPYNGRKIYEDKYNKYRYDLDTVTRNLYGQKEKVLASSVIIPTDTIGLKKTQFVMSPDKIYKKKDSLIQFVGWIDRDTIERITAHDECTTYYQDKDYFYATVWGAEDFVKLMRRGDKLFEVIFGKNSLEIDKHLVGDDSVWIYRGDHEGCPNFIEIDGADPKTFTQISGGYWKDKDNVYYWGIKLDNADPKSFKVLGKEYNPNFGDYMGTDNNNIYFGNETLGTETLDTTVIEPLYITTTNGGTYNVYKIVGKSNTGIWLAREAQNGTGWYLQYLADVDSKTFEILPSKSPWFKEYSRDNKHVYLNGEIIKS